MSDTNSGSAIVLGGSAGVGRAVVDVLRDRGYRVGVIARGKDRLADMAQDAGIVTAAADAGDAAALEAAVGQLLTQIGTPVVWVNCAMATSFSPFKDMPAVEFDQIIRTTFLGQVNGTRAALQHMTQGNIVNIGSGLSYRSVPMQSAYCAAKHAINGFTASVRSELIRERSQISLSLVQLPAMNTPQFDWARSRLDCKPQPAPPVYAPQIAAEAVLKAIDTNARELFVGRSVLKLIFGQFMAPDALDHQMASSGISGQKSDQPEPGMIVGNLTEPVAYQATANGSYGDRAEATGLIIDADRARKTACIGVPLLALAAGLAIWWAGSNSSRKQITGRKKGALPKSFGGKNYPPA